jgi:hypothetical protein
MVAIGQFVDLSARSLFRSVNVLAAFMQYPCSNYMLAAYHLLIHVISSFIMASKQSSIAVENIIL